MDPGMSVFAYVAAAAMAALGFALLLHLLADLVQQKETDFLDECNDYCHANVVSKLRVRPSEGNPG